MATQNNQEQLLSQEIFAKSKRALTNVKCIIIEHRKEDSDETHSEAYVYASEFSGACWALDVAEKEVIALKDTLLSLQQENQYLRTCLNSPVMS